MIEVKATIRDNDDSNFEVEARAYINGTDFLTYKDCMNTCSADEYDRAWNNICSRFESNNDLPDSWYIDGEIEEV